MDQNCKPFLVQFFWQILQTFQWHTTTQVPHIPKRSIELWWQLQNKLFTFMLLSSKHYSMWDFGEYSLKNQHILPSPKVSHAMKQTFDTLSTNLVEPLLLPVIYTDSLTMTIFLINGPNRLANQTRYRQLPHLCH